MFDIATPEIILVLFLGLKLTNDVLSWINAALCCHVLKSVFRILVFVSRAFNLVLQVLGCHSIGNRQ